MSDFHFQRGGLVGVLLSAICLASSAAWANYHFEPNQRMIYDVNITAQLPDTTQTVTGHIFYDVKSVDAGQATVDFFAPLSLTTRSSSRMSRVLPSFPFTYSMPRQIVISQWGRVVRYHDDEQLPYLLGNAWNLAIEPSPGTTNNRRIENSVEINRRLNSFPLPWFFNSQEHRSAEEQISYQAASGGAGELIQNKTVDLATDETTDGQPVLRETGRGQIAFDGASGWVKSSDMKYQIVTRNNGAIVSAPVEVRLKLLDAADSKKFWDQRQAEIAKMQQETIERNRPKLLDNATLDDALAKLKSVDAFRIQAACDQLAHAIVVKGRQAEVSASLEPLLKDTHEFVRTASAKALGVWADRKNIPSLSEAARSGDVFLRMAAIDALGHIADRRAADVVAAQLPDQEVRGQAQEALIKMGPVAEPAVIPLLKNPDWVTRLRACQILAAIGTAKSIPYLQDLSGAEHNSLISTTADKAVDAIRSRMK